MNGSNNSNDTSSYRMESYELIEPIPEINPNDFIYFKIEETSRIEDDFKNVNLNDYVDLNSKRLIDKYLHDLFSKRHKGKPYSRTTNNSSKNAKNEFTCFKSGFMKSMAHKSVQTNRFNMCTHKLSIKSDDKNLKHKDNKFLNTNNVDDNVLPQIISAKRIASTDNEETRKKLHITRISSNTPIFLNKSNSTNSSNNEKRYINIKCNTKLQHIPISQSLNKNYLQLNQNNSTLSYSFNRNGNNCNYITKQPISSSNRNQTQELKTYSRKTDNGYLSNTTSEQKYIVQHTTDKFHKIQNNITNIPKINHSNFYHRQNELKSVASSSSATATNGEHIKLMATFNGTHNLCGKANIAKQEHSLFSNNNNNNCSTYMEL